MGRSNGPLRRRHAIDYPEVEKPDYLVAISQLTYKMFAVEQGSAKVVIYDPFFVTPQKIEGVKQYRIPATDTALKELGGVQPSNLIILAALAEATGLVTTENMIDAIDRNLAARFRENNLRALEMGKQMAIAAGKEA